MRKLLAIGAAMALAAALTPLSAETPSDRTLKAPEKSLGDEGKLPPTENMSKQVPDMTGPRTETSPSDAAAGPSGPKGPAKRMGDEGTLPATNKMTNKVPEMTGPDANK